MVQTAAIIVKETKLLLRDFSALIMLFVLPAMFILILSVALQGAFSNTDTDERIEVLVVDLDRGEAGEALTEALRDAGRFTVVTEIDGRPVTRRRAVDALGRGRYKIGVVIPAGASKALDLEAEGTVEILVDPAVSGELGSAVKGTLDGAVFVETVDGLGSKTLKLKRTVGDLEDATRQLEKTVETFEETTKCLEGAVEKLKTKLDEVRVTVRRAFVQAQTKGTVPEGLMSMGGDSKSLELDCPRPEKVAERNSGEPTDEEEDNDADERRGLSVTQAYTSTRGRPVRPNSVQQSVPGWTIFALFWIVQILAVNIINDRQSGAFKRVLVAPISMWKYLAAKTVPFFIINLLQAVVMFSIGVFVLPFLGCPRLEITNVGALVALTVAVSVVSISFGLLMAAVSRTILFVAAFSTLVLVIMGVLGGIMVPKVIMPATMQRVSSYVPHGWALDGYLDVLVRGFGLEQVLHDIWALLGFAVVFFVLAMWRLGRMSTLD